MTVNVLIISHRGVGDAMLREAKRILGEVAAEVSVCEVSHSSEEQCAALKRSCSELNSGDGVLALTDLFGATPSNIATRLSSQRVRIVAGMNMPMLLKALSSPQLSLDAITQAVAHSARAGIIEIK